MSRSGYSDDGDFIGLWRGSVDRAIKGKRGQAFLRELLAAMDAMPERKLIAGELVANGCYCTLGVVGASRGMDMSNIDYDDAHTVGRAFGISMAMAAEIEYMNDDDDGFHWNRVDNRPESDEGRWVRMRKWVADKIVEASA